MASLIRTLLMIRRRKVILLLASVIIVFMIVNTLFTSRSSENGSDNEVICDQNEDVKRELEDVFIRSMASLQAVNLNPFLCYDSLWTVLSDESIAFSWKTSVELCLTNENVSSVEEASLIRSFARQGLTISYYSSTGEYHVRDTTGTDVRLKIFLFEKDQVTGNMRRVGWKHRLLPPDSCSLIHCFPTHLLHEPLPRKTFYTLSITVPREEIEIQKYHYPDDWWRSTRTPKQCQNS